MIALEDAVADAVASFPPLPDDAKASIAHLLRRSGNSEGGA